MNKNQLIRALEEEIAEKLVPELSLKEEQDLVEAREKAWFEKERELDERVRAVRIAVGGSEDAEEVSVPVFNLPGGYEGYTHINARIITQFFDAERTDIRNNVIVWDAYPGPEDDEPILGLAAVSTVDRFSVGDYSESDVNWAQQLEFEKALSDIEAIVFPTDQPTKSSGGEPATSDWFHLSVH